MQRADERDEQEDEPQRFHSLGTAPLPAPATAAAEADMMTIEITVPPNHKEGAKLMRRRTSKGAPLLLGPLLLPEPLPSHWPLAASLPHPCRILGRACMPNASEVRHARGQRAPVP